MKVIVDSSAILSILLAESGSDEILTAIISNDCSMSVGNYLESAIVVDSTKDPVAIRKFDAFIKASGIEIIPIDFKQVEIARVAYRDYGKGTGHPARLNFGDVLAYALASATNRELMCKGDDFNKTDIAIFNLENP
ncbi:MAG: type II toxin-antitoxin system VapC family toxin [Candidatus Planktophila sp.]|nr:type II toxin-antitoxin system VapC family toxin [Candidatus Planktophila sp.]